MFLVDLIELVDMNRGFLSSRKTGISIYSITRQKGVNNSVLGHIHTQSLDSKQNSAHPSNQKQDS